MIIEHFLESQFDALQLPLDWIWPDGHTEPVGQLLPQSDPMREHDGYFFALLTKRP